MSTADSMDEMEERSESLELSESTISGGVKCLCDDVKCLRGDVKFLRDDVKYVRDDVIMCTASLANHLEDIQLILQQVFKNIASVEARLELLEGGTQQLSLQQQQQPLQQQQQQQQQKQQQ